MIIVITDFVWDYLLDAVDPNTLHHHLINLPNIPPIV